MGANRSKVIVTLEIDIDLDEWDGAGFMSAVDTRRDIRQYIYNSVSELPVLSEAGAVVSMRSKGHTYGRPW
jgi:hypothetical protein